ncbi:MAG: hypothetical protein Q7T23_11440 [Phenylobacterium sp.]|jgi:hypothetical protein|uniref:Uncharacterized protein n=1 Tax=Phenylobacterium ferrooxidans TaxID=2982689 RepID=A0ABW6CIV4_9CAUL|nr:hypothetical protein [Phenylobacterium sp.]
MMTNASPRPDNRRATARIMTHEVLKGLAAMARTSGGDMIQFLVFSGIWSANTQHLIGGKGRYAELTDIPPDSQRRPISEAVLADMLCMPRDIVARYVEKLVAEGAAERLGDGLVIPSAVFTRPEMMDRNNEIYARVLSLVSALRGAGFSFGDED